jgi:hypothetical protein
MAKASLMLGGVPTSLLLDPDDVMWFGRTLQEKGIDVRAHISPSIAAARDLGEIAFVMNFMAAQAPDSVQVQVTLPPSAFCVREAAATIAMIRGLRRTLVSHPELLDGAWKRLAAGAPVSVPQPRTSERDHIWEVLNAAVYSHFATDVRLNADGGGVDLRGALADTTWGIECKMLYAEKNQRRIDRIIEGVKQLEGDSLISRGVVALNVTGCLDHAPFVDSFANTRPVFKTPEEATATLATAVRSVARALLTPSLRRRLVEDKHGRPRSKCRGLLFVGQAVAVAARQIRLFTSQFSVLRAPAEPSDRAFANDYHAGWMQLHL